MESNKNINSNIYKSLYNLSHKETITIGYEDIDSPSDVTYKIKLLSQKIEEFFKELNSHYIVRAFEKFNSEVLTTQYILEVYMDEISSVHFSLYFDYEYVA